MHSVPSTEVMIVERQALALPKVYFPFHWAISIKLQKKVILCLKWDKNGSQRDMNTKKDEIGLKKTFSLRETHICVCEMFPSPLFYDCIADENQYAYQVFFKDVIK